MNLTNKAKRGWKEEDKGVNEIYCACVYTNTKEETWKLGKNRKNRKDTIFILIFLVFLGYYPLLWVMNSATLVTLDIFFKTTALSLHLVFLPDKNTFKNVFPLLLIFF